MATKSRGLLLLSIALAGGLAAAVWWGARRANEAVSSGTTTPARGGELVVSLRNEPARYNRYLDNSTSAEVLGLLTHGRLVRVNRATDELEPRLAESWTQSDDGLTYTLKLRPGVRFSDGTPFTAADVLFTFRVLYDAGVNSSIALVMRPGGKPLEVSAPDPSTIVIRSATRFAPGLRMLDDLPILPRHKLEAALDEGRFRDTWKVGTPFTDIAGLGPFVLTEHVAGQRLVLARNPHYWLKDARGVPLPYVDKITILLIPDQNTEAIRVEAGGIDVMSNGDIRPEDYAAFTRAAEQGRLRLIDGGIGLDPNLLWFNLRPTRKGKPWFDRREFRQAVSYAVDRQAIVNTVFLGEAVPVYGPISPGNRTWYTDSIPKYEHNPAKARELLASIGLADTDGDGTLEDAAGAPVRFSILTQRGHTVRERTVSVIQEHLRQVGIRIDVVGVDTPSLQQRYATGDHDAIYWGYQSSSTDPALNPELWLSSGFFHVWNPQQPAPGTPWERRVDELMHQQTASMDHAERVRLMAEAQRIIGEEAPAIWFAVPKNTLAVSSRLLNPTPARQAPHLLWSAETLAVSGARGGS